MKQSLSDEQISELAAAWLESMRRGEEASEQVRQSVVMLTFFYTPQTQWKFILAAVDAAAEASDELYDIAAGPFEGLMGNHGDDYIDRVEELAARSEKFRNMLRGSWQHMMSDEVWARVQVARGEPTTR